MDPKILDQLYRDWLIHISQQRQNGMISDRLDLTATAMFIDYCKAKLERPNESRKDFEPGDTVGYSTYACHQFAFSPRPKGLLKPFVKTTMACHLSLSGGVMVK